MSSIIDDAYDKLTTKVYDMI